MLQYLKRGKWLNFPTGFILLFIRLNTISILKADQFNINIKNREGKTLQVVIAKPEKDFNYDLLIICNISTPLSHDLNKQSIKTTNSIKTNGSK